MYADRRLTKVLESARKIPFDDTSKFIFFSDCHRGDNSWADDFAHNQNLFFYALDHYYSKGFTYIEIGDGDELWENKEFADIRRAYSHVFWKMSEFYEAERLYLVWGNHDIERRDQKKVEETLGRKCYNVRTGEMERLFEGIKVGEEIVEGLVLQHSATGNNIFLVHGHQADPINDRWWWLSRFLVRHLWRHLQLLGVRDRTSPAKDFTKQGEIEARIEGWVETQDQLMVVCGHTHRSRFPKVGETLYFNTGSCVHPRCITGIEIDNGEIALIKWWIAPNDDGVLYVKREIVEGCGPERLQSFFSR